MAVSKRLRFEILRRDKHVCRYCGRSAPEVKLTVDHVIPVTLAGADDPGNLVAACSDCNAGKSSVPADAEIVADVASDALRWAGAMQAVAAERSAERAARAEAHNTFITKWNSWTYPYKGERRTMDIPPNWERSIDQFLIAGLEMEDLHELVDVAMKTKTTDEWRYFCGCCWKQIRRAQERAAEMLAAENSTPPPFSRTIQTRWTDDQVSEFLNTKGLECEYHDDGYCPGDVLCRIAGAARLQEFELIDSVREWKQSLRDAAICAEAEALLDG